MADEIELLESMLLELNRQLATSPKSVLIAKSGELRTMLQASAGMGGGKGVLGVGVGEVINGVGVGDQRGGGGGEQRVGWR